MYLFYKLVKAMANNGRSETLAILVHTIYIEVTTITQILRVIHTLLCEEIHVLTFRPKPPTKE